MNDKERLFLSSLLGVYLGPVLNRLAVPEKDQPQAIGYAIVVVPIIYHVCAAFCETYGPRIRARTLDKWFPPVAGAANPTPPAAHH